MMLVTRAAHLANEAFRDEMPTYHYYPVSVSALAILHEPTPRPLQFPGFASEIVGLVAWKFTNPSAPRIPFPQKSPASPFQSALSASPLA